MVVRNAAFEKIPVKQIEQKIGFSASPKPGDHLNQPVVPMTDQLIQIYIAFNFHPTPPIENLYGQPENFSIEL